MPRFVVLEHDRHGERHWDFMLETGATLATWALRAAPRPGEPIAAERLADHRLAYLDYEGPIRGDRGTVTRWDRGDFVDEEQSDLCRIVRLEGGRLRGTATLARTSGAPAAWEFSFVPA